MFLSRTPSRTLALVCLVAGLVALPLSPAQATPRSDNPLAGHRWGVYQGPAEMAWAPYDRAEGKQRKLLGRIALQPKAKWFGAWIANRDIADRVHEYIENATGGDEDVLVQLTLFRMVPWEQAACQRVSTKREKRSYKEYVKRFAGAIGDTHAAVVLQPDGPFALCAPNGSRSHSRLIAWTARQLGELPNTATYVDTGSAGWNHHDPALAARLLDRSGVEHVRGFHFNTTHYEPTATEIDFGAKVVAALAKRGIRGKHFTVDTAENGRPFDWQWWQDHGDGSHFNNAATCQRRAQTHCVTLGIPPTTRVAAKEWGLPRRIRRLARRHVDGYLWAGRPWLTMQTSPFNLDRALSMARTTPFR